MVNILRLCFRLNPVTFCCDLLCNQIEIELGVESVLGIHGRARLGRTLNHALDFLVVAMWRCMGIACQPQACRLGGGG